MKQKKLFYYLFLILLLTTIGCKDDIVNPEATIEGRINAQKPLETIQIHNYDILDAHLYLSRNTSDIERKINKAYAENDYLIVITSKKKYNFNLLTAKSVEVGGHNIDIHY